MVFSSQFVLESCSTAMDEETLRTLCLDLQKLAECPVCFSRLDVTHRHCTNGHGVCSSCATKLTNCPTCGESFLQYKPTLTNQLLERLPKLCSFADRGCPEILPVEGHETFCEFRPTECKMETCEWKGPVKGLIDHIAKNHSEFSNNYTCNTLPIYIRYTNVVTTTHTKWYSPILFENHIFWKCCCRNPKIKSLTHQFYHLPLKKPTHDYYFIVTFKTGDIEFKSTSKAVVNFGDSMDFTEDEDDGVVISNATLLKLLDDNKILAYYINIVKKDINNTGD